MGKYALAFLGVGFLVAAEPAPKPTTESGNTLNQKLQQTFTDLEVANAAVKMEIGSQGLLLAASAVSIEADGRVKLTDCALARFGKAADPTNPRRATTLRSEYVLLEVDQPIRTMTELGSRRILSAELAGGVQVNFKKE